METLVESRDISIQVKDVSGYAVCIKCKGGKTNFVYYDYNQSALINGGGVYCKGHTVPCKHCHGDGFWKALQ